MAECWKGVLVRIMPRCWPLEEAINDTNREQMIYLRTNRNRGDVIFTSQPACTRFMFHSAICIVNTFAMIYVSTYQVVLMYCMHIKHNNILHNVQLYYWYLNTYTLLISSYCINNRLFRPSKGVNESVASKTFSSLAVTLSTAVAAPLWLC